ncbi:biopolymer transporter ExbD [bacterium]|nr:biopolymer transporter ExbD [bacterium]
MAAKKPTDAQERSVSSRRSFTKKGIGEASMPPLTSLMDAMTIILLFLLKSFSAEEAISSGGKDLQLAQSNTEVHAEKSVSLSISKNAILLSNTIVAKMDDVKKQEELKIENLAARLTEMANTAKSIEQTHGIPFKGEVSIQVDQTISYDVLLKVLFTAAQAEFSKQRLLVIRNE